SLGSETVQALCQNHWRISVPHVALVFDRRAILRPARREGRPSRWAAPSLPALQDRADRNASCHLEAIPPPRSAAPTVTRAHPARRSRSPVLQQRVHRGSETRLTSRALRHG